MNNGIKPTRLWHLTGRKHFLKLLKDRHTAFCQVQRPKKDQLQLVGLLWCSAVALAYSYGSFVKRKPNIVRSDGTCGPEVPGPDRCEPPEAPCLPMKKPKYKPCKVYCNSLGRDNGFGHDYVWAGSLETGLQIASNHQKPLMVIIHKSWCSACKKLKPKFASSKEIQTLSKHFVMVNLVDEEEPQSNSFAPDGTYIPRILFLNPQGLVDRDIYNEEGSSQHKFFYSRPEQIAKSMRKVLSKYKAEKFDV